jgi:hypothetical protein
VNVNIEQLTQLTSDMTPDKWRVVPIELVEVNTVKLIQAHYSIEAILKAAAEDTPMVGDPFPHLVSIQRSLWAEDGLPRIIVWRIRGCGLMPMRVLRLEQ